MKRFTLILIAAVVGTLLFVGQSTSQAAYAYRRPAVRAARRAAIYRPRYYGPRPGYYRPGVYRGAGPGWYGPGFGFGLGIGAGVF